MSQTGAALRFFMDASWRQGSRDWACFPSPGIPGEGRARVLFLQQRNNPHPNPLPEYRERESDTPIRYPWS